ncbi:hypothetical protein GT360_17760 [Vibrio astriarenae]|uniref:Uncharacterized protein n=1 Tax=Vibrio astriarenae TaxID=1481923 RepID=A0A7Z2YFG8_9VIBR|nr:hypothetical protein [Vibrio astriarenae]QIA65386.1 hypothetical protein GT360_17760 [Vibrio astriarenae]
MNYDIYYCHFCKKLTEHMSGEYMDVEHDENGTPLYFLAIEQICLECHHRDCEELTKPKP